MQNPEIDELNDILDRERQALLTGDLERIQRLSEEKEAVLGSLADGNRYPPDLLGELRGKLSRNQELLDSALQGIRNVSDRLALLREVRRNLETYDAQGQRLVVQPEPGRKFERRA